MSMTDFPHWTEPLPYSHNWNNMEMMSFLRGQSLVDKVVHTPVAIVVSIPSTVSVTTTQTMIPHRLPLEINKPWKSPKIVNVPPMLHPTTIATRNTEGDCKPQPTGYGPVPKYDNMRGFYYTPEIRAAAENAPIPPGYVKSFISTVGSFFGSHYLGHYELHSFDPLECSRKCNEWGRLAYLASDGSDDQASTRNASQIVKETDETADTRYAKRTHDQPCQGFNIYFERSPAIQLGPKCRKSASRTIIKCALWGEPLRIEGAKNIGYREWDFDVVIAGSNGYNLEKYAETRNLATGTKVDKMVLAAILFGKVILGLVEL
jgi:hypothetical protein